MAYTPPIGIPNPSSEFGWEIDRPSFTRPSSWDDETPSATAGYYYIDNTDPNSTDSSNTYGHPGLPRKTLPYMGNGALSAGNVVYIHAGTYNVGNTAVSTYSLCITGTSESPFWLSGNPSTRPILEGQSIAVGEIANGASYCIIENLEFTSAGCIDVRPSGDSPGVDHILIRNCLMTGTSSLTDPNGIAVGGGTTEQTTDVVIYNCQISNYGKYNNNPPVDGGESEQACVYNDFNRARTWILDCTLATPGADSVAGSHNANDSDALSQYLYIGRNTIVCGGENAIDLKATRYVIISQNEISGHAFREQGWLVVLHSGANPVPCRDVAVIFNSIHGGTSGVMGTSTNGTQDVIIIGNIFYDIRASYAPQADPSYNGWAIGSFVSGGTNYIANNTAYDCDKGFGASNLGSGNTIQSRSNILSNIDGDCLSVDNLDEDFFDSDYNLFPDDATFFWNNGSRNFAYMQATAEVELNSLTGSPDFTNAGANNFTLSNTSPAIGTGVEGGAYGAFQTLFGSNIEVDFTGRPRPHGGSWDIGAYEYALIKTLRRLGRRLKLKGRAVI